MEKWNFKPKAIDLFIVNFGTILGKIAKITNQKFNKIFIYLKIL